MDNPRVTIITDTKNRCDLIPRCIESIQKQTYQNYEHIIADGGTDDTEKVVLGYNDPHIKYIKVPEGGPVAQTGKAFEISNGDLITFLDDDDEYLPEKLEKQVALIVSLPNEYGFIYGSMTYYDSVTKEKLYVREASLSGGNLLEKAIANPVICGTPTLMFRRMVFEDIGGTWISGIGNEMSDWALACKALSRGWKVGVLKESYLKIYINHGHVRMSNDSFYSDNALRYIKFHEYFLTEYAEIINRNPKAAITHYDSLISNYIYANKIRKAYSCWWNLIKTEPCLKNILVFPYRLLRISFTKFRH